MNACSKYALYFLTDGQGIANRLCRQLKKTMKKIKKLINEANSVSSDQPPLDQKMLLDVGGEFWKYLNHSSTHTDIPFPLRAEAVEDYLMLNRGKEEMDHTVLEMKSLVKFYNTQHEILKGELKAHIHISLYESNTLQE